MTAAIKSVLADWGTSSLRLWCVDGQGRVLHHVQSDCGMNTLAPDAFEPTLEHALADFNLAGDVPVLICGMAGAKQGWQETGYLEVPTRLDQLHMHAIKVQSASRDVRILPGLSQVSNEEPDIIRGEETLLAGALAAGANHMHFCLPGTHSKWVVMENAEVKSFKTFMTGELFDVLSKYSTLSPFLTAKKDMKLNENEFKSAIIDISGKPEALLTRIFSIRSGAILSDNFEKSVYSARLSGFLIGAELAAMKPSLKGSTALVASGNLGESYAFAMKTLDIEFEYIESRNVALGGLTHCADQIWT